MKDHDDGDGGRGCINGSISFFLVTQILHFLCAKHSRLAFGWQEHDDNFFYIKVCVFLVGGRCLPTISKVCLRLFVLES